MGNSDRGSKQRPHRPRELGPNLSRSGAGWIKADFRYLGKGRIILRNPQGKDWTPDAQTGEATQFEEVARDWVTDYLRRMREQDNARQLGLADDAPLRIPLREHASRYLDHRREVDKVAPTTWYNDQGALRLLLEWFGQDAFPEDITTEDLQKRINARLRAGAARSTCRTHLAILSHFFASLDLTYNPARGVKFKNTKGEKNAKKYGWSGEQIGRLREAADRIDQGAAKRSYSFCISARLTLELALNTGLREGELFAVEGCHFDEQNHTCKVLRQASRYTRGLTTTKNGSARTTFVLPDYWPFHPPGKQGLLLAGPDGKVILQGKNRRILEAVIQEAGIKIAGERNHMTRHTYSRVCLEEYRFDLRDLQKFLGHQSIGTTEKFYGHYSVDVAVESANAKVYRPGTVTGAT